MIKNTFIVVKNTLLQVFLVVLFIQIVVQVCIINILHSVWSYTYMDNLIYERRESEK